MRRSKSYWPVSVKVSDEATLESLEAFLSRAGFISSRLSEHTLLAEDYTPRVVNRLNRNRASRSLDLFVDVWAASHPEVAVTMRPYQPHSRPRPQRGDSGPQARQSARGGFSRGCLGGGLPGLRFSSEGAPPMSRAASE
jgi:hypothetical protein